MNTEKIRSSFPILNKLNRGKPIAYLDNAASSQKPEAVIRCIADYYRNSNSNVHRGVYELAEESERKYLKARRTIAEFFSVSEDEIIFTRGATESLNLVAQSFGRTILAKNDVVVLTEMEHHANIVPWQLLCEQIGSSIKVVTTLPDGSLNREALDKLLREEPVKILSLCSISNTLGTVNPIKDIVSEAHHNGTYVVVDGAQSVAHERSDLKDLNCDFFAFSGHKVFGPMGIGVLYGKKELLDTMPPYQGGGDMIDQVSFSGTTFAPVPQRFEAGTPNVAGSIGLGAAIDFLDEIDMGQLRLHEESLLRIAQNGLSEITGFVEHGITKDKAAVLSFTIEGIHPLDLASILDAEGIAIRTGHHCCQPLMEKLGVEATARASFALYNTPQEAERFVLAVKKAVSILR